MPDQVAWLHAEMLKTRVAHGYCSRARAAGACPYANICEQCDNFTPDPESSPRSPPSSPTSTPCKPTPKPAAGTTKPPATPASPPTSNATSPGYATDRAPRPLDSDREGRLILILCSWQRSITGWSNTSLTARDRALDPSSTASTGLGDVQAPLPQADDQGRHQVAFSVEPSSIASGTLPRRS